MTDRETFAPLVFFEYDHKPGHYCLMLSDSNMPATAEAAFAEFGYDGGGYGWAGVARSAVATQAPDLANRLDYDPEAGTFVAYGEDPEALHELGTLLQQALQDPATLSTLIAAGDPDWFD